MADLVVMGLDEHDRLIAFVLGLSHALNIAFFTALAESGEAAPRLARMSSTTFDAQLDVATRVAAREPRPLLRDPEPERLRRGIAARAAHRGRAALARAVHERDAPAFVAMMRRGHDYLRVRQAARERVDA